MKVGIDADERYDRVLIEDVAEGADPQYLYEVPSEQVAMWRMSIVNYERAQTEMGEVIKAAWKDGKRVDLEEETPPS